MENPCSVDDYKTGETSLNDFYLAIYSDIILNVTCGENMQGGIGKVK